MATSCAMTQVLSGSSVGASGAPASAPGRLATSISRPPLQIRGATRGVLRAVGCRDLARGVVWRMDHRGGDAARRGSHQARGDYPCEGAPRIRCDKRQRAFARRSSGSRCVRLGRARGGQRPAAARGLRAQLAVVERQPEEQTILEAMRVARDIPVAWATASADQRRRIVWSVFETIRICEGKIVSVRPRATTAPLLAVACSIMRSRRGPEPPDCNRRRSCRARR